MYVYTSDISTQLLLEIGKDYYNFGYLTELYRQDTQYIEVIWILISLCIGEVRPYYSLL